jgi:hypothetical protein
LMHFTRLMAVSLKRQRYLVFLQERSNIKSKNGPMKGDFDRIGILLWNHAWQL